MTRTDISNLALTKLGESVITDIEGTGTKAARMAHLHYDQALAEVLRAHFWGFAMGAATVDAKLNDSDPATAILNPAGIKNAILLTAVASGAAGNLLSGQILTPTVGATGRSRMIQSGSLTINGNSVTPPVLIYAGISTLAGSTATVWTDNGSLPSNPIAHGQWIAIVGDTGGGEYYAVFAQGNGVLVCPSWVIEVTDQETTPAEVDFAACAFVGGAGGIPAFTAAIDVTVTDGAIQISPLAASTAAECITAVNTDAVSSLLVLAANSGTDDGTGTMAAVAKTFLTGGVDMGLLAWPAAFELPADFLKLRAVYDTDGNRIDKFDLRRVLGTRCLVAGDYDSVVLDYVALVDVPGDYDPLFTAALATLLASKLARAITGSESMESQLRQLYETVDLPAARCADAQDTQSGENHPLKEMLAGALTGPRGDFFPDLDDL